MALLPGIFLRDLQLDGFVCFLQAAEQRRNRLAHLEVDGAVFDLNDDVVCELPVERMENIVGRLGEIVLLVAPVEMMVVDKAAVEQQSAVGVERAGNYVGGVGWGAAVAGGSSAAFGVRFHNEAGKIWNLRIKSVNGLLPPRDD